MARVLVALDSSELAPQVLAEAARYATPLGKKLVIVRVVRLPTDLPSSVFSLSTDSVLDYLRDGAKKELAELAKTVPAGVVEAEEVLVGSPWQAICDRAKELDVELIIVGAHGYGALERLVGTTSAKVVNHAHCSVLVLRPRG